MPNNNVLEILGVTISKEDQELIAALEREIAAIDAQLAELQAQRAEKLRALDEARARVSARVQAAIQRLHAEALQALGFTIASPPAAKANRAGGVGGGGGRKGRRLAIFVDGREVRVGGGAPVEALRTLKGIPATQTLPAFLQATGLSLEEYKAGGWAVHYDGHLVEGRLVEA